MKKFIKRYWRYLKNHPGFITPFIMVIGLGIGALAAGGKGIAYSFFGLAVLYVIISIIHVATQRGRWGS